ncbi:MAG: sulfur oxidation c-type cytochrome SoxA [Rhodospirillaceae bacterium]
MKLTKMKIAAPLLSGALVFAVSAAALAADKKMNWGDKQVGEIRSGYTYAAPETRSMQDDDFANPGMVWTDDGKALWGKKDGKAGKSCASCHGADAADMKGVATVYPRVDERTGKLENIESQINFCREKRMDAKGWKLESNEMLAMTVFVRHQSRGMKMNVATDGAAKPFYEQGKEFYYARRGMLDMSCAQCHETNAGMKARANTLSQGQSNGFPTYRLKWQKVGSIHRRFRGCNKQVRATPYKAGSSEYLALELYLASRGKGLPVETPAVRN